MSGLDLGAYDVLTFDCYGTLIDWERGILAALAPVLAAHGAQAPDETLLESYAEHEAELEAGPYLSYREVLGQALAGVAEDLGFEPSNAEVDAFAASVGDWPAFPDSPEALARLQERYRLAVITNCDDDLFAASNRRLGVTFDWVVTAEQARSYKPDANNFEVAFATIAAPRERILHVAQSLFHDHVTAKRLGLATVWIDRRRGRAGSGATPPAEARPDLELPDLASLADVAVGPG
jgi:2-haloacid dehalogenase